MLTVVAGSQRSNTERPRWSKALGLFVAGPAGSSGPRGAGTGARGPCRGAFCSRPPLPLSHGLLHTTRRRQLHTGRQRPDKAGGRGEAGALGVRRGVWSCSRGGTAPPQPQHGRSREGGQPSWRARTPRAGPSSRRVGAAERPAHDLSARRPRPSEGVRDHMETTEKKHLLGARPGAR